MKTGYFDLDDKTRELKELLARDKEIERAFREKMELSWIFHENALEGNVLDMFDLKAALDNATMEEGVLIPTYQRIRNHRNAIEMVKKAALESNRLPTLAFFKNLHIQLCHGIADCQGGTYRKDIPIHRSYYHEIAPPQKIAAQVAKIFSDMKSNEFKHFHPTRQGVELHFRIMSTFPFNEECGKAARLVMNHMTLRAGYLPIIIPVVDRQTYYESLRVSPQHLHGLVIEAMEATLALGLRELKDSC